MISTNLTDEDYCEAAEYLGWRYDSSRNGWVNKYKDRPGGLPGWPDYYVASSAQEACEMEEYSSPQEMQHLLDRIRWR